MLFYCYILTVIQLDSGRQPELWVSHPMLVPELPDVHLTIFPGNNDVAVNHCDD